jgi:hypothetical protein
MSVALPRSPRIAAVLSATTALGCPIRRFIAKRIGRDARTLRMLSDNVLADMGLEKLDVLIGTNGDRDIRVIHYRYD